MTDTTLLGVNHAMKEGELDPAIIALLLCLLPRRLWTQYLTAIVLFIIFFLLLLHCITHSTLNFKVLA